MGYKIRQSGITRAALFLFSILMALTIIPLQAFAVVDHNGTQGIPGEAYTKGTWNTYRQGYRVSVVNPDGTAVSGKAPKDFVFSTPTADVKGLPTNKFGHTSSNYKKPLDAPDGMPMAVVDAGGTLAPNGEALKDWLIADNGSNILEITEKHFGISDEDIIKYKIIFEPIFWYQKQSRRILEIDENIYTFINDLDRTVYGTVTNLAEDMLENKVEYGIKSVLDEKGKWKDTYNYDGNMAGLSRQAGALALITHKQDVELGINAASKTSGWLSPQEIIKKSNGYGIHMNLTNCTYTT